LPTLHPKNEEKSGYWNVAICIVPENKPASYIQVT